MEYDVEFNSGAFYPAEADVRLAEIAEDKGFGAVWKGESNSTDPLVLLSAMAARTTRIKLGTAVYHMFGRSPVTMGIQAATLNDLSDGRFLFGLGTANTTIAGWHNSSFARPLGRIKEFAEIVRKTARGEAFDYEGEFYQIGKFRLSWRPSHPEVPIYFAGLGPQMTRLTGRYADGVVINMATPTMVRDIVGRVRQSALDAGRDADQLEYIFKVRVCMSPDREAARRKLQQVLTFYMVSDPEEWQAGHETGYGAMFRGMGYSEVIDRVRDAFRTEGFRAAQANIPALVFEGDASHEPLPVVAATSIGEVQDRLAPYMEAGATRLIVPYVPITDDATAEATAFLNAWRG
jgi:alkanesulfonate monooxygenase SsuD/methylene tetrahydromethanopterin reductase-like flavin-dependent oxidoreductase (luciferase family)